MLKPADLMETVWKETGEAAPPAIVGARGLSYAVDRRPLIRDIGLEIPAGRRTVVMGANGAGKSLLLRLLHGLISPTDGHVLWKGRPLDAAGRRAQAMVFQRPVMLRRSVLANLQFALRVHGLRGPARRARERSALALARLEHLAGRPARVLSGGEQQRLAVARALACEPELLFLDEPTASLDPASTHAIESLIQEAHAAGVTIVMVTHDRAQALRLGDHVLFMSGGRIVESGPAARVLDAPRSEAAQAWLEGRLHFETGDPERSQAPGDNT
ncbi:ABC transporter ATP-binding protein [Roseibium aquae]|uniref:ABC transporter ATP-binding protein n=1 Tax=Roseibium aquae TaxID=1323746 RepID=A0A916X021_9HYPH|nr:ATP-binding cassette domain-containing protein [Roseibium aquae]GGB43932.1 ABC transporter ATP-binding protein [Roseibium aquae]